MNITTILSVITDVSPFEWHSIGASVFCGAVVGLERQIRGKPVGIRTSSLITLGTYLFITSAFLLQGEIVDPSRVIGQVITGIGFLGAGVMLAKDGAVVGVTSAATIWVLASLGVMIGVGYLIPAIKLSLLVVAILYGVDVLEDRLKVLSRGVHSRVKFSFYKGQQNK
ncbi:MgtC/SapB family protein [Teredinibacter sp. KSP-S5-2]|uniref:MgtC/SapB family protein n=1 Tax=Teredinibacter sp. KSP-S5-2 TaxID=3034506 RepID=UPI0029340EEC|nr:MgtC/SapB family protein [Teredinibacter sp. KSP-S5-2]WNO10776.1 MgtC/SapB family protein [Teredinibacter sp. KSP-S5-2]